MAWKDIPGHDHYQCSDSGEIRRNGSKILKPQKAGSGYLKVKINGKQPYIHRLVALTFIGDIPKCWEINHLNFNRRDNRPGNLEICTRSQNQQHAACPEWYFSQTKIPFFDGLSY